MKGFKKDGKFRPTEKRNKSSLKKQDVVFKKPIAMGGDAYTFQKQKAGLKENFEQQSFDFNELSDSAKQNAVDDYKEDVENEPFFYTEDEGLLYDVKNQFAGHEVFKDVIPKGWGDLDGYGDKVIQFNLELQDNNPDAKYSSDTSNAVDKLFHYLKISSKTQEKVFPIFPEPDGISNEIEFKEWETGYEIGKIRDDVTYEDWKEQYLDPPDLTKSDYKQLQKATEKWNELMKMSAQHLIDSYQWYMNKDNLKEDLATRGEEYDKYGRVSRTTEVNGVLVKDK